MRLIRFKVADFRSVDNSDWIDVERVTALIGVNESGKTNLLLPLWKFNPAREGEIKPTSDYPKGNFAAVRADPAAFDFITTEFELDEDLAKKISELTGVPASDLRICQVSRDFEGTYTVEFPGHNRPSGVEAATIAKEIDMAIAEIGSMSPLQKEGSLKDDILATLRTAKPNPKQSEFLSVDDLTSLKDCFQAKLPQTPAPTSSLVPRIKLLCEALDKCADPLKSPAPEDAEGVFDLVIGSLPRFVYYSNYGNLDSEIYLPHVVDNLKRKDLGAREAAKARTLRVLFSFVRLQPKEILELGRDFATTDDRKPSETEIAEIATKKRERTILLNSAGTDLTKRFKDWWKQGDYTFEFQADGDHFRIWVSDSRRPEKVELEDRSSGLQWFLSFYLIFLVESSRDHRGGFCFLMNPGCHCIR
jgi:hypothetical protein